MIKEIVNQVIIAGLSGLAVGLALFAGQNKTGE